MAAPSLPPIRMCVYIPKKGIIYQHDTGQPFLMTDDPEYYFRKYHVAPISATSQKFHDYYEKLLKILAVQRHIYMRLKNIEIGTTLNRRDMMDMISDTGELSKMTYAETKLAVHLASALFVVE